MVGAHIVRPCPIENARFSRAHNVRPYSLMTDATQRRSFVWLNWYTQRTGGSCSPRR